MEVNGTRRRGRLTKTWWIMARMIWKVLVRLKSMHGVETNEETQGGNRLTEVYCKVNYYASNNFQTLNNPGS